MWCAPGGARQDLARLMIQVHVPEERAQSASAPSAQPAHAPAKTPPAASAVPEGAIPRPAGGKAGCRRRAMRRRALSGPPPELLIVPQRIGTPALKKAAAAALRQLYKAFERFQVCLAGHLPTAHCRALSACSS